MTATTQINQATAHTAHTTAAESGISTLASRSCCVCKKELTDAASVESGIGPICRKRSNDSLARTIPADVSEAKHLCYIAREKGILLTIPCLQSTVDAIIDAIIMDPDSHMRADWRIEINRMAWVMSHDHIGGKLRCLFQDLAAALGYVATVALWRGEAVMGKCQVTFDPHTRIISTKSPIPTAEARQAMKDVGMRFDPHAKTWTAPVLNVQYLNTVRTCISTYFLSSNLTAFDEAKNWLATQNPVPTPDRHDPVKIAAAKNQPVRLVWTARDTIAIHSPYNGAFVSQLKEQIPAWARTWNSADKVWMVHSDHQKPLRSLIQAVYGGYEEETRAA